ncbi:unnamed protein product [Coregonus sp. 'balchen']|nr:unnamed protein product [Coregonus sp. 'balchen']
MEVVLPKDCCMYKGVLDDEDVRAMMRGSNMVKVRSQRWQKSRSLRLLEDGVTVWCESTKSSRKAKAQQTCEYTMGDGGVEGGARGGGERRVSVTEVECVREGCQSEALRRLSGSVPENQCFTVVFRGARKSLDLLCPCEEEARHWVRGIRTLKERVANMTQKEKLDQYPLPPVALCCAVPGCQPSTQSKYSAGWAARIAMGFGMLPWLLSLTPHTWIRGYLKRADENDDGKMSYDEVKRLLQMINIDLNEQYACSLFKYAVE